MRRLRWKSRYLTGTQEVDRRNRALVAVMEASASELRSTEHCQDMDELYDRVVDLAEERFGAGAAGVLPSGESDAELRDLVDTALPLAARETPACRDCDACDHLRERLIGWADEGPISASDTSSR